MWLQWISTKFDGSWKVRVFGIGTCVTYTCYHGAMVKIFNWQTIDFELGIVALIIHTKMFLQL